MLFRSQARALARMDGCRVWEDADMRWTVVLRRTPEFVPSPTYCVVSVQPLPSIARLRRSLDSVAGALQGCAVAGEEPDLIRLLAELGVSYICEPGKMQAPPLSWREDDLPVLSSLLP